MTSFWGRLVSSYRSTVAAVRGSSQARNLRHRSVAARARFLRLEFLEDRSVLSTVLTPNTGAIARLPAGGMEPKFSPVIAESLLARQAAVLQEASAGVPRGISRLSDAEVRVDSAGQLQVYVHLDAVTPERTRSLTAAGMTIESDNSGMRVVQGWIPAASLNMLTGIGGVTSITAPDYAQVQTGSVNSAGDAILKADAVRGLGITGAGVKVGVISDGVNHRSNVQSAGDLPNVTVNPTLPGNGDEGTAMLEIVHDLAPGAELYFSGPGTSVDMVNTINWMVSQGVDVIIDDLAFFGQPYFQDGTIASAAAAAVASGAVYVTCATNYSQLHYQAAYVQGANQAGYGDFHQFASGDLGQSITIGSGQQVRAFLEWSDSWGAAGNDYDLFLVRDSDNSILATSNGTQDGNDFPFESIAYTNNSGGTLNANIRIAKYSGVARELELYVLGASSQQYTTTADSIFGHAAADGVIAVGAISALDSGWDTIENFSSRGPSTIYTNFSTQSKILRNSLDGATIDGVQTKIGQLGYFSNPFYGTSAASPHAGAIAALLLQANPTLTPAQVTSALTSTAVDLGSTGYDQTFGSGRFDALAAVNQVLGLTPLRFDFGTASSPVESGYAQVTPSTSYPAGASPSYGWTQTQSLTAKDSGSGSTLDRDTNIMTDGTFLVDVANGTYQVDVRIGELNGFHDQTGVSLEGVQVDSVTASGYSGVVARTYTVTVADGQLTMRIRDLGGYFAGAAITSLVLTPIPTPAPTAPSGLTATTASSSQINLAWTDNASSEQGFKIERKLGAGGTWGEIATVGANTTSYQSTGLAASSTYYYRVRAYNSSVDSAYSNEANATTSAPETIPNAPTGLNAQAVSASQINLSWTDSSSNEQGFKIERRTGIGGTWSQIATVGLNVTTYQSTGLTASTTYYYRVRSYNGAGDSSYSNESFATTSVAQPTAARFDFGTPTSPVEPNYLQVTQSTSYPTGTSVTYGWSQATSLTSKDSGSGSAVDRDTNITTDGTFIVDVTNGTYQVEMRLGELNGFHDQTGVLLEGVQVDSVTASGYSGVVARSYTVTVGDGQLTVRLKDLGGYFAGAAITALVVTPATTPAPAAPTSLTATAASSTQISLAWTDNASSEQGFKIERKTGVSGTWSQIATVGANTNTYQSTGLSANTTYYYRVRAYNGTGDSSYSNEANTTTLATDTIPATPTNLTATATSSSQINLAWQDNSNNEQGFKIERKTGVSGTWSQIATVGANTNTYQNTGLSANTSYYYRVRAYNGAGDSSYSNEPFATTASQQAFTARFDFGTATSPVESGYLPVTPSTSYPSGTTAAYGWLQTAAITARDVGLGSALDRDANITTDGTFVVDVPNGTYQVDLRLGELYAAHDQTAVILEGVQVDNVTASGYSGVVARTYTVTIADGKLTLGLKDLGGYFSGAAITALVVTSLSS